MPQRDTGDFATAFAIGAALGIGATLLLRPRRSSRAERLLKEIEPYRKQAARRARRARKRVRAGSRERTERGSELVAAGRDRVGEFRGGLSDLLSGARDGLVRTVEDRFSQAPKTLKRRARRIISRP